MGLTFIKDYVYKQLETKTSAELAKRLKISVAMLSSYKTQNYKPSLTVAKTVYKLDSVALHPFSEESLQFEIKGK
jgi:ribosome-binding protein aMBF1 (putative translation factor)